MKYYVYHIDYLSRRAAISRRLSVVAVNMETALAVFRETYPKVLDVDLEAITRRESVEVAR